MTKLPVLFLIAIISLSGCTNKNEDNFQSQPIQAAVSPTTSQPTNTPIQTPEQTPLPMPLPSQNQTASSSSADSNSIVYTNKQYGFQFSLPDSWRDYTIHKTNWQGYVPDENSANDKTETGPIISIRDPRWTQQTPRQDIPIMVLTKAQWTSIQQEKLFIGAAPIGPSLLGQNEKYVFVLPARYNFSFPPGYEEVDKILQNYPLKAFN